MKDSLFEMLMNFFEKSLSQLIESKTPGNTESTIPELVETLDTIHVDNKTMVLKPANDSAMRIFILEEQTKFTKASHQFLARMMLWGIIATETMEQIINQLLFSDSRYVTLEETKWTIRNTLAESLDPKQLAFLDLVLYQKEDKFSSH